jgi:hypothetical protein
MPLPSDIFPLADGTLDSATDAPYVVFWNPHDPRVVLDGMFAPAELHAIAAHMERIMEQQRRARALLRRDP